MILDNIRSEDYSTFIEPFLSNGVIVDTCILYEIINGLVETRIHKKKLGILSEFEQINIIFDLLHLNKNPSKLFITPHILTETCRHLEVQYNKNLKYKEIVSEFLPIIENMSEYSVSKIDFCKQIDKTEPIIESGDISIFVTADDFTLKREKITILTKDRRIRDKYSKFPYVLVIYYPSIIYNLV